MTNKIITAPPPIPEPDEVLIQNDKCYTYSKENIASAKTPDRLGNFLLEGHINFLFGQSGMNKSILAQAITADVSNMRCPLNGGSKLADMPGVSEQGVVLFYAAEDNPAVISRRLQSLGARYDRVKYPNYDENGKELFNIDLRDTTIFESHLKLWRPRLVVFDVIMDFVGKTDASSTSKLKAIFASLRALAEQYRVCILLIHHSNSNLKTENDVYQSSYAFRSVTRSAIFIIGDPLDPKHKRRIVVAFKSSYFSDIPNLSFSLAKPDPAQPYDVKYTWYSQWVGNQQGAKQLIYLHGLREERQAEELEVYKSKAIQEGGPTEPEALTSSLATAPANVEVKESKNARKKRRALEALVAAGA